MIAQLLFSPQISAADRRFFYEELAYRTGDGIAIGNAIEGFWQTQSNYGAIRSPWLLLLRTWADSLNGNIEMDGPSPRLSDLATGHFPAIECAFIRVAESEGDEGLQRGLRAARDYAKQMEKHRGARASILTNVIPWAIGTWFLTASTLFAQNMILSELGIIAQYNTTQEVLATYLRLVTWWFWPVVVVVLLIRLASLWFMPNWTGPGRVWCDRNLIGFRSYARYQGLAVLTGLAFMLSTGKTAAHGIDALRATATPWLLSYLDPLLEHCRATKNDLVAGLKEIGGHFPTDEMVRRLDEANKSATFGIRAADVLKREVAKSAKQAVAGLKRTNDSAMWISTGLSLLAVVIDFYMQSAIDIH